MKAISSQITKYRKACKIARPLFAAEIKSEIENNAMAETQKRPGAIKGSHYYYHEDTIDCVESKRAIGIYRRALKAIDAAMTSGEGGKDG